MSTAWQDRFPVDASLLPLLVDLDKDQLLVARLSEEDFRKASFLDQRIVTAQLPRQLINWEEVSQIKLTIRPAPRYIFHIGHVGSTLISRLLGEDPSILALREPQLLRALSEQAQLRGLSHSPWSPDRFDQRFAESIGWLSRTFRPDQKVIIKASSFVSEIAADLLKHDQNAVFLYARLDRYLPTILAGEASLQETQILASARLQRLNRKIGEDAAKLWELSPVQKIAMSWLSELISLITAESQLSDGQILWMNFDDFLQDPATRLKSAANHFGLDMSADKAAELANGPIMSSYSKAPEHDYSPNLRAELLAEATEKHAAEIEDAMLWVEGLAAKHPLVARVTPWLKSED